MAQAHINPEMVDWAIRVSGFPLSEIADALKLSENELKRKIEDREDLTLGQLSALRKKLRRPSATFYLPEPPADIEDVSYRTGPETKGHVRPPAERLAIRRSKRIQNGLREILVESRLNLEPIPRFSVTDAAREVAEEARRWLHAERLVQDTVAQTFHRFRELLGERRIFVLLHSFGDDGARGFSLQDEIAPVIGINTKLWNHSVRSYTAAHELGHILTRTSSSCRDVWEHREQPADNVERWCEVFAAQFLMPLEQVQQVAAGIRSLPAAARATRISNTFHVSRQAAFLRLVEIGELTQDDYRRHYVETRDHKGGGAASPDDERRTRAVNNRDMLGQAALDVFHTGITGDVISPLEVTRLLGVEVEDIAQFARGTAA